MKNKIILLVTAIILGGIAYLVADSKNPVPYAQEAVKRTLTDPESAQFKEVKVKPNGAVCGEVNAKNGFGGYTGFQRFAYASGRVSIYTFGNTDKLSIEDNKFYLTVCG